eukprot:TRINITY_DN1985_c0_g1_i2.p1 TRINITY_DN1985_c0_g1~~TRINITY_DN1985_c0_g1_i2.p1  ORF type:complete len:669 (-),score=116.31 TRINITY_DN1985_c0_g1_i2:21-2027(-)
MKIFGFILFMCLFLHFSEAQNVTLDFIPASKNYWASHGNISFNSGNNPNSQLSSLLYVGNVTGGSLVLYGIGNYDTIIGVVFVLVVDPSGIVTEISRITGPEYTNLGYSGAVINRSDGKLCAIFDKNLSGDYLMVLTFDKDANMTRADLPKPAGANGKKIFLSSFREDMIVLTWEGELSFTTDGQIIDATTYQNITEFSLDFPIKSLSYHGDVFYANSDLDVYSFNFTHENIIDRIFHYSFPVGSSLYNLVVIDDPETPSLLIYDGSDNNKNGFYWAELPIGNSSLRFDSENAYQNSSESVGFCGTAINNHVLICTETGFSSLTIDGEIQPPESLSTSSTTTESFVTSIASSTIETMFTTSTSSSYESTVGTGSSVETTTSSAETTTISQSNIDTTSVSQVTTTVNSISTTTSKEMDSTTNPCEIFGGSNCNSNSDGTNGGITIGDTDDTEPEVITIGGEGEDISIGGDISTGQINITLSGNLTIGGTLNVGGGTTIVFSKGTITAECVYFEDGSFIQVDLTAEEKKQLAENDESVVLINSECVDGEEQFTERTSDCQNGVQESYNYDNGQLSASFSTCIEPGYIILIMAIIIAVVAGFICLVFFTPLQKVIFPHRQEENKRDSIVRDERLMDRLTVLDTELKQIQKRTDDLDKEIAELESNEISSSA